MPNGKGFAQCHECINFIVGDRPHCKKHNFYFPLIIIGYEILCRDYSPAYSYSEKSIDEIKNLDDGYLFYYCCQGEKKFKKLERFNELKYPIYGIHILEDGYYKWLFEVKNYYEGLWEKKSIILQYANKSENFIQHKMNKEIFTSYTFATKKVSYSPQSIDAFVPQDNNSEFLNYFIENFIGLKKYRDKKTCQEKNLFFGISAFLKGSESLIYTITPDLYFKDFFEKL